MVLSGGMGEGAKFSPGAGVECRGCRGASPSRPVPAWLFHTHCASPVRADISLPCCCPGHTYPAALAGVLGVLYDCLHHAACACPALLRCCSLAVYVGAGLHGGSRNPPCRIVRINTCGSYGPVLPYVPYAYRELWNVKKYGVVGASLLHDLDLLGNSQQRRGSQCGESEHPHTTWPPPCHQFAAPLLNNVAPHAARPLASCSTPRRVKSIAQVSGSSFLKKRGRRSRPQH